MSAECGLRNRQDAKNAKNTYKEARKAGSTRRAEGPTLSNQEAAEAGS